MIGDLVVESQTIGLVTNASESFYDIPEIDGILGLSHYAAGTHCMFSSPVPNSFLG